MRVTALATVGAAILPACAIVWPDATCQLMAVMLAVAWRMHQRVKELRS